MTSLSGFPIGWSQIRRFTARDGNLAWPLAAFDCLPAHFIIQLCFTPTSAPWIRYDSFPRSDEFAKPVAQMAPISLLTKRTIPETIFGKRRQRYRLRVCLRVDSLSAFCEIRTKADKRADGKLPDREFGLPTTCSRCSFVYSDGPSDLSNLLKQKVRKEILPIESNSMWALIDMNPHKLAYMPYRAIHPSIHPSIPTTKHHPS